MAEQNSKFWAKAVNARQELAKQYAQEPDVTLIDIGYAPQGCKNQDQIVLRIHVKERWYQTKPEERVAFHSEASGIPVCVVDEKGQHKK